MGENKHMKELDAFAKKYLTELPENVPSANFTANVMKNIEQLAAAKKTMVYKPLISLKGWLFIVIAIAGVLFRSMKSTTKEFFALPEMNFSFLEQLNFTSYIEQISISSTTASIVLVFGFMFLIQILYLKGFYTRKFNF